MIGLADLSLEWLGFPLQKAQKDLQQFERELTENAAEYQHKKAAEILEFHLKNNSYYRTIFEKARAKSFQDAPILTKTDFQQPLSNRLSAGFTAKNVYVNKTSGSSGEPFIFAKDKYCHALTWAYIKQQFGAHGIDFNRDLQARFYGIPLEGLPKLKEEVKDFLMHRRRFPVFDLSDKVLETYLARFRKSAFAYLNGYTSSLLLFAKFLAKKGVVLKDVCSTLKAVFTTSEMLFESDRQFMERAFGVPIVNEYGASELDLIAFENPSGVWKINQTTLLVEILNERNEVLPYGEAGKIVITALYNRAHPFIRYDIGDNGILDFDQQTQTLFLKQLTGRTNDIAVLPSGKTTPGLTFYYVTKSIIQDQAKVKEFVIKQTTVDSFTIEYVASEPLSETEKSEIIAANERYLESGLHFTFVQKTALERSRSGKLKQFSVEY